MKLCSGWPKDSMFKLCGTMLDHSERSPILSYSAPSEWPFPEAGKANLKRLPAQIDRESRLPEPIWRAWSDDTEIIPP